MLQLKHKLVSENGGKFFILIKYESTMVFILYIGIHTVMCTEVEKNKQKS